jgi:glycosyltransferase involved in cell wall biosynthesis
MRVLVWANGQDTGGQGHRIAEAFRRHAPDWHVDSRSSGASTLGYPGITVPLRERQAEVLRLYAQADVVHLRNNLTGWAQSDRGQGKPTILHHHGSQFRRNHGRIAHEAKRIGAVQIASTIDLTLLEPDVQWMPSPYEVDELARMRTWRDDGRVRIAYFPTSPRIKSAPAFMAAFHRLAKSHDVELLTNVQGGRVRHMPWADVLAAKARADIYFDQVLLGYGNNAIEAWSMGLPVIAGVADPAVREAMLARWGSLPFYEATEDTIEDALRRMVESVALRGEYAAMGMSHVLEYHDARVVVRMLSEVYEAAPGTNANVTQPVTTPRNWAQRRASMRARQQALRARRVA